MIKKYKKYGYLMIPAAVVLLVYAGYAAAFAGRILPRTSIGNITVGGLTQDQAVAKVRQHIADFARQGVVITVGSTSEAIALENIEFAASPEELVSRAFVLGRNGSWYANLIERVKIPLRAPSVKEGISFDDQELRQEIAAVARVFDQPGKDIRFLVSGTNIRVLTDTKTGQVLDQQEMHEAITRHLATLDATPLAFVLHDDVPVRDPASVPAATVAAQRILASPLNLEAESELFVVSPATIGQWLTSVTGEGRALMPDIDQQKLSQYVTTLASQVNIAAQQPLIKIQDGKVIQFQPPRSGKGLDEEEAIADITAALRARRTNPKTSPIVVLPIKVTKPVGDLINGPSGIVELIGKATTTFTGSPANRVSNIKNGVKFLTGVLIQPGQEFSTVKTLGTIDNTTGYLPELVIKENRTVPEFGGGLCQVSTTLFRAVLNAGLPVTARRNHSYRVSYYEKDALGHYIGPGLDATIYQPDPDFRFLNDTGATILVYGYVIRDTVTFELYGTHDGRTSSVKGPTLLSTIPAGEPIYTETDTLPAGVTKQVETAHAGGTAVATYTVTYPSGTVKKQEFRSSYRRWPAQYLVGTGGLPTSPTPTAAPSPTASPTASPSL